MVRNSTDRAWDKFGALCPYFGVITDARYLSGAEGDAREEFFASGKSHVDRMFENVRVLLSGEFAPDRALDFGCGVGRIAIPLARRVGHVVGVDVSESMLEEARRNADAAGVNNLTLLPSDDDLSRLEGRFDFVHSYIVLQHIPPARGARIFQRLVDRLEEGGVGVVHVTYAKRFPRWRRAVQRLTATFPLSYGLVNLLRGRPYGYPQMQMNDYDVNRLLRQLQESGCHDLLVRFSDHGGHLGVVLYFHKKTLPSH